MSFLDEINEQPAALMRLTENYRNSSECAEAGLKLKKLIDETGPSQYIFTGMGSSLFAGYIACAYLRRKGLRAYTVEANELLAGDDRVIDDKTVVVAVSQSGNSMETLSLCKKYREFPNLVTLTNLSESNLYGYGAVKFLLYAGKEYHTSTKSYTNTVAALLYIMYIIAGEDNFAQESLFGTLTRCASWMGNYLIDGIKEAGRLSDVIGGSKIITAVGTGASCCTVCHMQLLFFEAARRQMVSYSAGQFIHGPVELIDAGFCSVIFDFDPAGRIKIDEVSDLTLKYGGKVLIFTNRGDMASGERLTPVYIPCGHPYAAPIYEIIPVELTAYIMGVRAGYHPGNLERIHK